MKTALITGGSEGIGFAMAEWYAKRGYAIILAARNKTKLLCAANALGKYKVPITAVSVDLSRRQQVYELVERCGDMDVVIANAGSGGTGEALYRNMQDDENMVALNCISVMNLLKLYGRKMQARGQGTLVTVASTGAFQPGPYIACYYATKAFVLSYTRALAEELKGTGVHVCCICPGPVKTAFYEKYGGNMPFIAQSSEQVAKCLEHVENKSVVVSGWMNKAMLLVPASLRMKVVGKIKKGSEQIPQENQNFVEDVIR